MIGRAAPLNSDMRRRDFINLLGGAGLLCPAKARRARAAADNSGGRFCRRALRPECLADTRIIG